MTKKTFKSIAAVLAGFIIVVILSVGTDFVLESLHIFPPQSEPLSYTSPMLMYALGGYVTARLAPDRPGLHAVILGIVGIVAGTIGMSVAWDLSPHHWYPIALVVTALPCTWLGGRLKTIQKMKFNSARPA